MLNYACPVKTNINTGEFYVKLCMLCQDKYKHRRDYSLTKADNITYSSHWNRWQHYRDIHSVSYIVDLKLYIHLYLSLYYKRPSKYINNNNNILYRNLNDHLDLGVNMAAVVG